MNRYTRRSLMRHSAALLGAGLLGRTASLAAGATPDPATPLRIGNDLQLFVDDYFIQSLDGVQLTLQQPQPAGTAIAFDQPWEGNVSSYVTVLHGGGKFRMYYRGVNLPEYSNASALKPGEVLLPKNEEVTCYAESNDGVRWEKPKLGIVDFKGSKANNIIHNGVARHNFAPFLDTNPAAAPANKYKALGGTRGLFPFHSADGIHWEQTAPRPVITDGAFDSLNIPFYDERRKRYVAIYRDFRQGVRTVKYAESQDFLTWSPGVWADYGDTPPEQLYTNATTPYFRAPQIYLAFPKRFVPWLEPIGDVPGKGVSESVFMTSRDGVHWDRRFMEAFVRPGRDPRNWVHRNNLMACGVHPTAPGEMSLYIQRHYNWPSAHVERLAMRLDGFVSAHANYRGGLLTTKPFLLDGTYMVLNFATSAAGGIRYEVIDEHGYPLPGLGVEQTRPLYGDFTDRKVEIQPAKRNERSTLASRPVRVRFHMRDADLFSVKFEN